MSVAVALVQGASRGLGLEISKYLCNMKQVCVVATCRNPKSAKQLQQLKNVLVLECDVTNEEDLKAVSAEVLRKFGKLDFAINVSGILHPSGKAETKLQDVDVESLQDTFAVNTFGPLMFAKHMVPLLKKGDGLFGRQSIDTRKQHRGVLAHISARVGSISDNRLGGWYSYRMSKCALNMANKNLSIELGRGKNKVVCLLLHPGTVDTTLSKPYHKGVPEGKLFTTQYSVNRMMSVVEGSSFDDTGRYLAWDGSDIPF